MPKKINVTSLPFALTRFLSVISLALMLASALFLALFIGRAANRALLGRQQQYSQVVAANLNKQLFRQFTVPVFLEFGRIALRQPLQYKLLDTVIKSSIVGQYIESLRIFDQVKVVGYSLDDTELGRTDIAVNGLDLVYERKKPVFEIISVIPHWRAFFMYKLPPQSFILHTVYPLTIDDSFPIDIENPAESPVLGVLELTHDITQDYSIVIRFQWIILLTCMGSSLVMFSILQFFIIKAERIIADRIKRTIRLENELHQNEKLASMGRVIASIAHEIRNPLGIIRSSAEFLLRRTPKEDTTHNMVEAIFDESCRLSQTVNDFLDYARPRSPQRMPIDMSLIVNQVCAFLEGEFSRRKIELMRQSHGDLRVNGDKDLLYRALYNIVSNALQAMNDGGSLKIEENGLEEDVRLDFYDTGPGFGAEDIKRALDPFFTTKDTGTGLGLPIVNTIITSHGGQLLLANNQDGGALVSVILPRVYKDV